jgi:RNA polymerase sigma factor (TIGR02999 family)
MTEPTGTSKGEISILLDRADGGDKAASDKLFELAYAELRRQARAVMRNERRDHTLQPTALANLAYIRLTSAREGRWHNRQHFFKVAASAMRCILVDYARARRSVKRGGGFQKIDLEKAPLFNESRSDEVLAVDEALKRLAALDSRQAKIVELSYFMGLTQDEIAAELGISTRTVKRDLEVARLWLLAEFSSRPQRGAQPSAAP